VLGHKVSGNVMVVDDRNSVPQNLESSDIALLVFGNGDGGGSSTDCIWFLVISDRVQTRWSASTDARECTFSRLVSVIFFNAYDHATASPDPRRGKHVSRLRNTGGQYGRPNRRFLSGRAETLQERCNPT
jgi:hypothetical protein